MSWIKKLFPGVAARDEQLAKNFAADLVQNPSAIAKLRPRMPGKVSEIQVVNTLRDPQPDPKVTAAVIRAMAGPAATFTSGAQPEKFDAAETMRQMREAMSKVSNHRRTANTFQQEFMTKPQPWRPATPAYTPRRTWEDLQEARRKTAMAIYNDKEWREQYAGIDLKRRGEQADLVQAVDEICHLAGFFNGKDMAQGVARSDFVERMVRDRWSDEHHDALIHKLRTGEHKSAEDMLDSEERRRREEQERIEAHVRAERERQRREVARLKREQEELAELELAAAAELRNEDPEYGAW